MDFQACYGHAARFQEQLECDELIEIMEDGVGLAPRAFVLLDVCRLF